MESDYTESWAVVIAGKKIHSKNATANFMFLSIILSCFINKRVLKKNPLNFLLYRISFRYLTGIAKLTVLGGRHFLSSQV